MRVDYFHIKLFFEFLYDSILFFVSWVISLFYIKKDLYLISERGTDARDNGLFFFLYLKREHPNIEVHFVISQDSVDINNLCPYQNLTVNYRSFRHYLFLWRSKYLISTHIHGYSPEPYLSLLFNRKFHIYKNKITISLKHGITKDNIPGLYYKNTLLDLVVCGAKPEYDYVKSNFGYPEGHIQYLGFCRFDGLHSYHTEPQVLLMPTWRNWLTKDNFVDSQYFRMYRDLLSDPNLSLFLRSNDLQLVFYPHHEVQPFIELFDDLSNDKIIIARKSDYDVQTLLKQSVILITDYSSVLFDFAYMRKPLIFYQFDENEYRGKHYSKGYFDYNESFGQVTHSVNELLVCLQQYFISGWRMPDNYKRKCEEYFPLYDDKNCRRVFDSITSIIK